MRDDRQPLGDRGFEQRLRGALRAKVDEVPFSLTVTDLESRLARRRRPRPSTASLGAAAAIVLAIALGAVASDWSTQPPVGSDPTPTPGSTGATPAPAALPTLTAPVGRVVLEDGAVPRNGITWTDTNETQTKIVGRYEPGEYRLQFACEGGGELSWSLRGDGSSEAPSGSGRCGVGLAHSVLGLVADAPGQLTLDVQNGTAWHVILSEYGIGMPADLSDIQPVIPNVVVDERSSAEDASEIVERVLDGVPLSDRYVIQIACFGPGTLEWALGGTVERPAVLSSSESCERGDVSRVDSAAPAGSSGPVSMLVRAPASVAWRVMVEIGGDLGPIVPPAAVLYVGDKSFPATPRGCVEAWMIDGERGSEDCPGALVVPPYESAVTVEPGEGLSLAIQPGWTMLDVTVEGTRLNLGGELVGTFVVGAGLAPAPTDRVEFSPGGEGDVVVRISGTFRSGPAEVQTSYFVLLYRPE